LNNFEFKKLIFILLVHWPDYIIVVNTSQKKLILLYIFVYKHFFVLSLYRKINIIFLSKSILLKFNWQIKNHFYYGRIFRYRVFL